MDEQVKRILVSTMLAIDILIIVYIATLGNWELGAGNDYFANLDDRLFGVFPLLLVVMYIKLLADLYWLYFLGRCFQESVGLLDKALADTNWFLKPGLRAGIGCLILHLLLVIFDPFDFDAFDDNFTIKFGDFFASSVLFDLLIAEIFILVTMIGLFFFTKTEE